MRKFFSPVLCIRLCLFLCAASMLSGCLRNELDTPEYYREKALEIAGGYTPRLSGQPGDATLHFAWAEELQDLTGVAHRRKMAAVDASGVLAQACEHYDKALALEPQNAWYALKAAYCRVFMFEESRGGAVGLEEARAAVVRARALAPKDTRLAEMWGEALLDRATDKRVPEKDAQALLQEADSVYADIFPHAPKKGVRATQDYFLRWRGKVAIAAACRASDSAAAQAALARANGYFEQSCEMDPEPGLCRDDWARALDPKDMFLADPAFAGELLAARLHPLLMDWKTQHHQSLDEYMLMDLCETYERLVPFQADPQMRETVLLQGKAYCELALREVHESYRPRVSERLGRIEAGLAALHGRPNSPGKQ